MNAIWKVYDTVIVVAGALAGLLIGVMWELPKALLIKFVRGAELSLLEAVVVGTVATLLMFALALLVAEIVAALNLPEWLFIHHDCPNPKGVCL